MSIYELDAKVAELKELRNLEAEVKAEITSIEDEIKSEMLAKNVEVLQGQSCKITWKCDRIRRKPHETAYQLQPSSRLSQ